jgi:hypothetical protein
MISLTATCSTSFGNSWLFYDNFLTATACEGLYGAAGARFIG